MVPGTQLLRDAQEFFSRSNKLKRVSLEVNEGSYLTDTLELGNKCRRQMSKKCLN